jgi:AcrR family transcriptional regulator
MPFSEKRISDPPEVAAEPLWQVRALDRSLADTRARSVARLSLFVAAARSLAEETGSSSFTVQQVVARSGQSLKSFYRYFESKDDLLVALLEEDIAVGALFLRELIDGHETPTERIREWLVGLFELMSAGDKGYVAVLVRESQRLAETRPDLLDAAVAPFLELLAGELERGVAAGVVRAADAQRDAHLVFQLTLSTIHDLVSGRDPRPPAEVVAYLWDFCWGGLHVPGATGRSA